MLGVFGTLEAVLAFCVGCKVFGLLMARWLIPKQVCAESAKIWFQPGMQTHAPLALSGADRP